MLCVSANAQKYIAISTDSKVFETAQAKDEYAAQNSNGDDVILKRGMCFIIKEQKAGWYTIEYTQGLRGMVMVNVIADASTLKKPAAGEYSVANATGKKVNISNNGSWTLKDGDVSYTGTEDGNIVIFTDKDGNQTYSLTVLNGKPMVYSYANSITKYY